MIKIEGKVDVDLDESSDSEPEEELTPSGVMEQTIEVSFENTEQVDEEEEVEYFGPNSKHAKQQPEPKLASILSAKVKEVENNPTSSAQTNSGIEWHHSATVFNFEDLC